MPEPLRKPNSRPTLSVSSHDARAADDVAAYKVAKNITALDEQLVGNAQSAQSLTDQIRTTTNDIAADQGTVYIDDWQLADVDGDGAAGRFARKRRGKMDARESLAQLTEDAGEEAASVALYCACAIAARSSESSSTMSASPRLTVWPSCTGMLPTRPVTSTPIETRCGVTTRPLATTVCTEPEPGVVYVWDRAAVA